MFEYWIVGISVNPLLIIGFIKLAPQGVDFAKDAKLIKSSAEYTSSVKSSTSSKTFRQD